MGKKKESKQYPLETPEDFEGLRLLVREYYDIQPARIQYDLRLQDQTRRWLYRAARGVHPKEDVRAAVLKIKDLRKAVRKGDAITPIEQWVLENYDSIKEVVMRDYGLALPYLVSAEKDLNKRVEQLIAGHPVANWMQSVRGVAHTLTGAFMSEIGADRMCRVQVPPAVLKLHPELHEDAWVTHPARLPEWKRKPSKKEEKAIHVLKRMWEDDTLKILEERNGIECFETSSQLLAYSDLTTTWISLPDDIRESYVPEDKKDSDWDGDEENEGILQLIDDVKYRTEIEDALSKLDELRKAVADGVEKDEVLELVAELEELEGLDLGKWIASRRRKGKKTKGNQFLKTLCFKFSDCFVKSGGYFRGVYDSEKEKQEIKIGRDVKSKGHADMRARRKAGKLFYCLAWEVWRRSEGLSVRAPYAIEKLGHQTRIDPWKVIDEKKAKKFGLTG